MNKEETKKEKKKSNEHLPHLELHHDSDLSNVLNQLSNTKSTNLEFTDNNSFFKDHLSMNLKYDFEAQKKCKLELRNQNSPSKWKVSTNCNSEFNKEKHTNEIFLSGWDMEKANMPKRSYEQPKCTKFYDEEFHGIKSDYFSREFPHDLSKTYSKGFNKKLKEIELEYENKLFQGNLKNIEERRKKSIDAIRSRGTRFQLSKDKLFGFVNPVKISSTKHNRFHSTVSHFYQKSSPSKNT